MSTATTSDLVRRRIQLTHVSSLSMTVSRIWSFSLADNCVLRWTSGWRVTRGRYLWIPDCLWQTLIERTCPCTSILRHGMITNLLRPGLQLQRATWRTFRISLCTLATIPDLESTRNSCGYVLCRRIDFVQLFRLCSRSCRARIVFQSSGDTCLLWVAGSRHCCGGIINSTVGFRYSFLPRRDKTLPWAYGHTSAPSFPLSSSTEAPVTRAAGEKSWSADDFGVPRREAQLHLALPRRVLCVLEALGMD
jgi:hypothetical protein